MLQLLVKKQLSAFINCYTVLYVYVTHVRLR